MKYFLSLLILAGSFVFAQEATAVKRSINIGGDLSQWDGLAQYPVELSNAAEAQPVSQKGYFSMTWDDTNLYVLGVFTQPKETLTATLSSDAEEWWLEDTMEIFLRLPESEDMLHYASSPLGSRFSSFLTSSNYFTHSRTEDTSWILEMAFPLGLNELPAVKAGDKWELKVGRGNKSREEGEKAVFAAIAEMEAHDRLMAERLHGLITSSVPELMPKTWYGMPAYANSEGKVICFFQAASKFKVRYATFAFQHDANLDEGDMWATGFALAELSSPVEKQITEMVKKAVR